MKQKDIAVISFLVTLSGLSFIFLDQLGPWAGNPFLDTIMHGIELLGKVYGIGIAALLVLLLAFLYKKKELTKQTIYFIGVYIIDTALIFLLKAGIGRERPIPGISTTNSFPSGHASRSMLVTKMFGDWYPKIRKWLYVFLFLEILTRIYFGTHYLSDIFAGLAISYTTAIIYLYIYERYL